MKKIVNDFLNKVMKLTNSKVDFSFTENEVVVDKSIIENMLKFKNVNNLTYVVNNENKKGFFLFGIMAYQEYIKRNFTIYHFSDRYLTDMNLTVIDAVF